MAVGTDGATKEMFTVGGVRLSAVESGIRYADRLDCVLVELAENSVVSGVFTKNAFCAAPVSIAKRNLRAAACRYFLINTGNANAGTGEAGMLDAESCCDKFAAVAGVDSSQVLPFSTGVIGERLPVERLVSAMPALYKGLDSAAWLAAATGILTTDTRPKMASKRIEIAGKAVSISGIAKGSGMIKPDMATML
ncbi:MAG: bifunctional ornithine acetyltransferase/N-acetylglutamate synthase, partial [Pseudomonadales bacterium]|nr:bifunctional ornithine acetyltransferase/N-acetylglutamate synthase [Pseudomonadales bacterium]